jgi:hypothetical protein
VSYKTVITEVSVEWPDLLATADRQDAMSFTFKIVYELRGDLPLEQFHVSCFQQHMQAKGETTVRHYLCESDSKCAAVAMALSHSLLLMRYILFYSQTLHYSRKLYAPDVSKVVVACK